jgi:ketosteroid isomerase-like protein
MTATTSLHTIKSLYEALAAGDAASVRPLLDPQLEWTEAAGFPLAGTYHGPEAVVRGVLVRLATEWDGFETAADRFVDGGETIVVLGHYRGTYKRTGKSFEAPFAHVWEVRDGRATRYVQYTDTFVVQQALR